MNSAKNEETVTNETNSPPKPAKKKKKKSSPPIIFNCLCKLILINFIIDTQYDVIKEVAEEIGWKLSYDDNDEWDVYWSDLPFGTEKLTRMRNYQKVNHFPSMYQICRKNLLAKNMKQMEKMYPVDYKFTPKTWSLPYEFNELK